MNPNDFQTGAVLFAESGSMRSLVTNGVIHDPFHPGDVALQFLPVLLILAGFVVFALGWRRRRTFGTARPFPTILCGLTGGIFLLDLFCLVTSIARVLSESQNLPDAIHTKLILYQIACMLSTFSVVLPLAGVACLAGLALSKGRGRHVPQQTVRNHGS